MSFNLKKIAWFALFVAGVVMGLMIGRLAGNDTGDAPQVQTDSQGTAVMHGADTAVMSVEAIRPVSAVMDETLSASGNVVGKEIANVGARMTGVAIERVLVDVGDYVKAGQVLAVLDAKMANQDVAAAEAELKQALATYHKASADLARVTPLIAIDAISREQFDAYQTAKIQAEATVSAVQARLNNIKTNRSHANVVAPVSGIISARQAEVGMMAAGTGLFSIIKNGALSWQASIRASEAGRIVAGQMVEIDTPTGIATAQVTRIDPVTNASRDLVVHADILDGAGLRSGMYQSGRFIFAQVNALTLPQRAIMNSDGYDYVWRLQALDGDVYQVVRQNVTLGKRMGERVAVDVPADALVVAQSGSFLNDGDKVRVVQVADTSANTSSGAEQRQ